MGYAMGGAMGETGAPSSGGGVSGILGFISGLPAWAQAMLNILLVAAVAAIIGLIIGKAYASVKYPDPEKHYLIHPVVRLVFICLIIACCAWLYFAMTDSGEDAPIDEPMSDGEMIADDYGGAPMAGSAATNGAVMMIG